MTSDIDWICLRCGKAYTFDIDNCMKCNWTRPPQLKELKTNLRWPHRT